MIIAGFWDNLGESILRGVKAAFSWIIEQIVSVFVYIYDLFISGILALFPSLETSVDSILEVIEYVNYFVPLGYGFTLLSSYYAIVSTVVVYRWILKHIPTLG